MKKVLLMIFLGASLVFAQEPVKIEKGRQIVEEARKNIEKKSSPEGIKSIYLKINSDAASNPIFEEFSFQFPNKLYKTYSSVKNSKSIYIWNGNKYLSDFELTVNGRVIRQSVINAKLSRKQEADAKKAGEETLPDELKEIKKKISSLPDDPKTMFLASMWEDVFPIILQSSFEPDAKFEYVGKAEAPNKQRADVVDVKSDYFRKLRLFFDEKTHLLLLMTVTTTIGDTEYQESLYYSDYQLMDGILVAKQIKKESKKIIVGTKSEEKLGTSVTTIEEFELNPKFSDDLFKID